MTDHSKGFDRRIGPMMVPLTVPVKEWRDRLADEAGRVRQIVADATPPVLMREAPVAPARGPQHLVPNFTVTGGGMRRVEGGHWQGLSPLAAAVAQARLRHEARNPDVPFVPPFNPAQVAVAEDYAALVEWREGSALRCASLEGGRSGGGGAGLFIDTYIDQGRWLDELRNRIGDGVAMSVRRHMDRGNARRAIKVRVAVDLLCLNGVAIKAVLRRFGWVGNMRECGDLRAAICGALDRMQGYSDGAGTK